MASTSITELEARVQANPDDGEAWYQLGVAYYGEANWMKAYECFANAEIASINSIGDRYKAAGNVEAAQLHYRRAQKIQEKSLKLASEGSDYLKYLSIITGSIAVITLIPVVLLWPSITALIFLLAFLIDFIIFWFLFPFALARYITRKRHETKEFLFKIEIFEKQMQQAAENTELDAVVKFVTIEKLKQKRARAMQQATEREYTDSLAIPD
jgi:tetratricopeptide (TPR) repeat protein